MSARSALPALAIATAAALLIGCTSTKPSDSGGKGISLVKSGKLTTCTHLPYPPFQARQGKKIVGFDVDLVDLVASELKVKQEIVDTPFEGIQSGEDLNSGTCDVAAAGMTITDVREKNLDFSRPYFEATQALLTRKGKPYRTLRDLKGKRLAVQQGTTGETYAQKRAVGATLVQFEDLGLLVSAVKTGQVAAGINDNGVLYDFAKDNPDTEVTAEFPTGEKYGIAVRTGNDALRKKIDQVLRKARADGRYDRIYRTWFGTAPRK